MVQRRGRKLGITTSKTLRRLTPFYNPARSYKGAFSIKKYFVGQNGETAFTDEFQKLVPDGLETRLSLWSENHTGVEYSLNKRKRWQIPRLLKKVLQDADLELDELPYRVVLVERSSGFFQKSFDCLNVADCISVYKSKDDKTERRPKGTFAFDSDLHGDRRRVPDLGMDVAIKVPEGEQLWPELTYEVYYPRPKGQYPWFDSGVDKRYNAPWKAPQEETYTKKPSKMDFRNNKSNKSFGNQDVTVAELHQFTGCCVSDVLQDFIDVDDSSVHEHDCPSYMETDATFSLGGEDLMSFVKKRKSRKRKNVQHEPVKEQTDCFYRKNNNRASCCLSFTYPRRSAVFEPQMKEEIVFLKDKHGRSDSLSDSGILSGSEDFEQDALINSEVTYCEKVSVLASTLNDMYLARNFGWDVQESSSFPKSFAFNVGPFNSWEDENIDLSEFRSDDIQLILKTTKSEPPDKQMTSGIEEETLTCRLRICDLRHAAPDNSSRDKTNRLAEIVDVKRTYGIEEILSLARSCLKPNQKRSALRLQPRSRLTLSPSLDVISSMKKWNYRSKTEADVVNEIRNNEKLFDSDAATPCGVIEVLLDQPPPVIPEMCDICCDVFDQNNGGELHGVALRKCRHWFCDDCWQFHMTSRIQRGDVTVTCPAFGCKSSTDSTTLLTLLPDNVLPLYSHLMKNQILQRHQEWEWCPNPKCNKMVQVNVKKVGSRNRDDRKNVIYCDCGWSWCGKCKEAVHWPAMCQQAAEYRDYVEKKGIDYGQNLITYVEVKRCPECCYPMEKNGGCQHMSCRCGYQFCWECLENWKEHYFSTDCQTTSFETVQLSTNRHTIESYMHMAIDMRKQTSVSACAAICDAAKKLCFRLYNNYKRTCLTPVPDVFSSSPSWSKEMHPYCLSYQRASKDLTEWERIEIKVFEAAKFSLEIGFVIEHIIVMIGTCGSKFLRQRRSGWLDMIDRLTFIMNRLQETILGNQKYPEIIQRLDDLVQLGRKCLKTVAITTTKVHQSLTERKQIVIAKKKTNLNQDVAA